MTDMYLYGVRARVNAGFGLWHLAYASNTALDGDHFAPVVAHMRELRGDRGASSG